MNSKDVVIAIAKDTDLPKAQVTAVIHSFWALTTKALKRGEEIRFTGIGTFKVTKRAARKGFNPQTHLTVRFPARKVVKFKAGAKLKNAVK